MAAEIEYTSVHNTTVPPPASMHHPPQPMPELQRLIWHTLHLSNVLLSQLGAYLSLEALHRDCCVDGLTVPTPHLPLMAAQAAMMADGMRNLEAAADTLARLPSHEAMRMQQGGYRSLIDTAGMMRMTIGLIANGLQSKEDVYALRSAYDGMNVLCYGDAAKGIQGWKETWTALFGLHGR